MAKDSTVSDESVVRASVVTGGCGFMHRLAPPWLTWKPKLGPPAATHDGTGSTMKCFPSVLSRHCLYKVERSLPWKPPSSVGVSRTSARSDLSGSVRSTAWFVVKNGNSSQVFPSPFTWRSSQALGLKGAV